MTWNARLVVMAVLSVVSVAPSTALGELPRFVRQGLVIDPLPLTKSPTNYPHDDAIFSSVIDATEHFAAPLGRFHLYFGPHDGPGGIFLAYSDSINGPWSFYDADESDADLDPVIGRTSGDDYSVSHVASPHALWIPEESRMFLWFHGENSETRYASTTDGTHFEYEGIAVTTADFNHTSETSYARVFRASIASKDAKYVMMLMGNQSGTRPIFLAWSSDARHWKTQWEPLLVPHGLQEANPQISAPHLLEWDGKRYIVYHQNYQGPQAPPGAIWATLLNEDFAPSGPPRLFFAPLPDEDHNHVWSPSFIAIESRLFMFYDSGPRLHCKIRYASAALPPREAGQKNRVEAVELH